MIDQGLPMTERGDWGQSASATPTYVWLTIALGLAAAVTAPFTLPPAQFAGSFLIGGFMGAFITLLVRSASPRHDPSDPQGLVDAVHMAAVGAVLAVVLTVLMVTLGISGWAIAVAAVAAYAVVRRLFALPALQEVPHWS